MPTSSRSESARNTGNSPRRSSRADTEARDSILNLLKDDHKRAKKAFRDFEKLDPRDEEACQALVTRTLTELEIHSELEEDLLYPAARNALSDDALIEEAEVEHMTFRMLIDQLKEMEPSDDKFTATFTVLGEYVKHHVKEEEGEIFPGLSRARMNWRDLWEDMQQTREDLMAERGMGEGTSRSTEKASSQDKDTEGGQAH